MTETTYKKAAKAARAEMQKRLNSEGVTPENAKITFKTERIWGYCSETSFITEAARVLCEYRIKDIVKLETVIVFVLPE